MRRLVNVSCWTYLLNGSLNVVFGTVLINLLEHYGKGYSGGGTLVMLQFLGFLAGVLTMPWWNRLIGRRRTLVAASAAVCLAEGAIGLLPPWSALYVLTVLAGLGFGLAEGAAGTAVLDAAGNEKAAAMGKLEVSFGVGALAMPFAVAFFISYGIWTFSFFMLSAAAFLLAIAWGVLSFRELNGMMVRKAAEEHASSAPYTGKERAGLGVMMLFFFIYVGLEVCLVNFLPSVFTEEYRWDSSSAALTVTGFWATVVLGRIIVSWAGGRLRYAPYLIAVCAASTVLLFGLSLGAPAWVAAALVLLLGLAFAGIFAIALIYANELLPGRTERTSSLCIAAGGLGGSAMPAVFGGMFEVWPPGAALAALAAGSVVMLGLIAAASRLHQ